MTLEGYQMGGWGVNDWTIANRKKEMEQKRRNVPPNHGSGHLPLGYPWGEEDVVRGGWILRTKGPILSTILHLALSSMCSVSNVIWHVIGVMSHFLGVRVMSHVIGRVGWQTYDDRVFRRPSYRSVILYHRDQRLVWGRGTAFERWTAN